MLEDGLVGEHRAGLPERLVGLMVRLTVELTAGLTVGPTGGPTGEANGGVNEVRQTAQGRRGTTTQSTANRTAASAQGPAMRNTACSRLATPHPREGRCIGIYNIAVHGEFCL